MIQVRYSTSPSSVETATTADLRENFLVEDLFAPARCTGPTPMTTGWSSAAPFPATASSSLPAWRRARHRRPTSSAASSASSTSGSAGHVLVDGEKFELDHLDGLFVGRGSEVVFAGAEAAFYFVSAPAHATYPTSAAEPPPRSSRSRSARPQGANERSLYRYAWGQDLQDVGAPVRRHRHRRRLGVEHLPAAPARPPHRGLPATSTSTRRTASSTSWASPAPPATS